MCRLQSSNLRSPLPFHVIICTWMTSGNKLSERNIGVKFWYSETGVTGEENKKLFTIFQAMKLEIDWKR